MFCRQPPGKKPSCVRKSQRQRDARQRVAGPKKAFKLILCPLPNLRLLSRKNPGKKPSCVRKSQRQRDARQRVAGPKKAFKLILCPLPNLRLLSRKNPGKKPSCVRKSQCDKIAASESRTSENRRTKKGLEAHPLSNFCVHCHALHCFVGSSQARNLVASENRKREAQLRQKIAASESRRPKKALKLILCQNLVFSSTLEIVLSAAPRKETQLRQKIAASENRSVRESHVRESQAQTALLSQASVAF